MPRDNKTPTVDYRIEDIGTPIGVQILAATEGIENRSGDYRQTPNQTNQGKAQKPGKAKHGELGTAGRVAYQVIELGN